MKFGVLQITGADGRQRTIPLELPSIVLGRAEGNSIVIDDLSLSRRHARLVIDSGRLMVEDLGSAQGTFIDGEQLKPNTPSLVDDGSELRFGDIIARYEPPAVESIGANATDELDLATSARLGVTLTTPSAPVYAGAPWVASLRVHNRSNVVDRVTVSVPDLPAEWVRIDRAALALPSGSSEDVHITVMPPYRADSLAGEYDFTVLVSSQEHQREASALGKFVLHPFRNLALGFETPRTHGKFVVVAENKGNEPITYLLSGEDPDAAWRFDFELPAVTLQPGERRDVRMRVHRQRQLMGIATALPFSIHAASEGDDEETVTAIGQLAINPPLQKFRAPVIFLIAAVVIAAAAIALMLIRSDDVVTTANAEDAYEGVHLCDPQTKAKAQERDKQAAAEAPKPGGSALVAGGASGAPYFAQNDPRWAKDEYARAKDPEFGPDWCGSTIEQCGCAMTSVATTMALFGLLTMPDGSALTPQSLNNWFNAEATKTNRGWVSRGYIYGDVVWTAANQLSGEMAQRNPGSPTIRFARTGSGSDDEVREQLKLGRPIILEVPGHWIAAVGLQNDKIMINDPFYRDRATLDVYKGKVRSSVMFEPSDDLSAVVFTAPADVRVRITDKEGRVVGTLATGSAEDAQKKAVVEIPGASYSSRKAWRDPSCIESAPPPDAGTNQIILPGTAEDYKIEVLDAAGKPTSIAIHTYDKQGKSSVQTIDNPGSAVAQLSVDPAKGKADVKVIAGGQPTAPKPSPTTAAGGPDDQQVGQPSPTATRPPAPTPTPEPVVETGISIGTIPGDNFVAIQSQDGFAIGDQIIFSPGQANEEENRIVGFGSFILETPLKFAHSPGEIIRKKPRAPGSGGNTGGNLPPPVTIPPLVAPESLTLGCSAAYVTEPKEATLICTLDVLGPFTTTRWSLNGKQIDDFNNQQLLVMSFPGDSNQAVGVSVCNRTICKSTSTQQKIQFPVAGATTGGTTGSGTNSLIPPPATATPPAAGIVVNCAIQFEQGANPKAVVTCAALFTGPSTSVTWTAPGASPASGAGKTFTTNILPNTIKSLKVTATVCNFAICQTSPVVTVGIGSSTTKAFLKSAEAALNATTTFTAIVTGPVPPAGGTIQFRDGNIAIGPSVPIFTAGALGFAQITVQTGTSPLTGLNSFHPINAVYSGGTNLFGSTSSDVELKLVAPIPDVCDSINNNPTQGTAIDETCDLSLPRDVGGGTNITELTISGLAGQVVRDSGTNNVLARPNAQISVASKASRTEFCPGCIRQVYLGFGANTFANTPAVGPACVFSGGLGSTLPGTTLTTWNTRAPQIPGIYYVRGSNTLDYSCVAAGVGPPDLSVGRVVVQAPTQVTMTFWTNDPVPVPITSLNRGDTVRVIVQVTPSTALGAASSAIGDVRLLEDGSPGAPDETLDANGRATFLYTQSTSGPHTLQAHYFGYPAAGVWSDQFYLDSSTSPSTEQAASTSNTSMTMPTSAKIGDSVSATVTVSSGTGYSPDGGTVTLMNSAGVIIPTTPAAPVIAGGTVTFSFVPGSAGIDQAKTWDLVAVFNGNSATIASRSTQERIVVSKADSSTVLALTPATNVVLGDDILMTATVTGVTFGSPDGGTVTFKTGNTTIGTATVSAPPLSLGVASLNVKTGSIPALDLGGPYSIVATFEGTTNLNASTSPAQTITVQKSPSVLTTPSFSANPTTVGAAGTISVIISPPAGRTPGPVSGKADFYDGTTLLPGGGNISVVAVGGGSNNATASYSLALLDAGTYANVKVHYQGNGKYEAGDSPTAFLNVNKADPSVTLTPPGTAALGSIVRLTAQVSGSGITSPAGGTVQFLANGQPLCGIISCPSVTNGTATLDVTTALDPVRDIGTYTVTAHYSGNTNLNSGTDATGTLTLTQATPSITLQITPSTATIGDAVTFTAVVTAGGPANPINTDGATITFQAGANTIAPAIAVSGGSATLSGYVTGAFPLDTGDFDYTDIRAVYSDSGNANVAGGTSAGVSLRLDKAPSSAALSAISGVTLGQSATFTVTMSGGAGFSLDGAGLVQFYSNGSVVGAPVSVSGATASITVNTGDTTPFTTAGSYAITAVYAGTSKVATSTAASQSFVVSKAPSATVLTITTGTLTAGGSGTLIAAISPTGSAPGPIGGTVTFSSAERATLGTITITNPSGNDGLAVLNISGLNAGTYTNVVATYSGSAKYDVSNSTPVQTFTIAKATPLISLADPGTHTIGTAMTFSATVSGPATGVLSPAGGTVTFYAGSNAITTATVSSDGVASATITTGTSPLDTGATYSDIRATFVDDGPNLNSVTSSPDRTLVLNKATPTVTLNNNTQVAYGGSITFTATVTASGTANVGNGAATVDFTINGAAVGSTQTLSGGSASVTINPATSSSPLGAPGAYTVTATYNGSSQVNAGSGTDSFNVVKATPTVSVTNDGSVTVGSAVTITAVVSAAVPTDGGTVTFSVGGTTLGTSVVGGTISANCGGGTSPSGQAKCVAQTGGGTAMPSAKNSPYTVTASFATTAEVAAGSGTTSVTVDRAGPTVTITGGTGSVALGSSVSFVVNVSGSCSGGNTTSCPTGGSVTLYIGSVGGSGVQTATVSGNTATFTAITTGTSPFANAGSYSMIARFNGDATNGNVSANESAAGTLTLTAVTPTVTVTGPSSGAATGTFSFTATVTPNFSPSGTVQFKDGTTNLGTAITLSGNTAQISGVTLTAGTHTITVTFTNTSANYSGAPTIVSLTVTVT